MLVVVDPHSGKPVFRQIIEQIRFHVASGLLEAGDELPSTRSLSAELGINPMTVSKAFSQLEEEGVVERRPGLPLVVKAQAADEMEHSRAEQIRARLAPVAVMVRQLDFDRDEAIEMFRRLIDVDENER